MHASDISRRLDAPVVLSTRDRIIAALKDAFFSGALKPGDAIVERRIASDLKVGTPPVREALIALQEQGFVKRVANTATYVTQYSSDEARQAYSLRVELELLAFQWAKPRATAPDLDALERKVDQLLEAGENGEAGRFIEIDLELHESFWKMSGNRYLVESLRRHMTPLSVFVVLASGVTPTAAMAREHYALVNALRHVDEPEFSNVIRKSLTGFAFRWLAAVPKDGKSTSV